MKVLNLSMRKIVGDLKMDQFQSTPPVLIMIRGSRVDGTMMASIVVLL